MNTNSIVTGPYTDVLASTKSNTSLDGDLNLARKEELRENGIFLLKIFDNLPVDQSKNNYIAVKSIQLDNGMYNYDPKDDIISVYEDNRNVSTPIWEKYKCMDIEQYMLYTIGIKHSDFFLYNKRLNSIVCRLKPNQVVVLSDRAQHVIGAPSKVLSGPYNQRFLISTDLYTNMRPIILTMPNVEVSFVNETLQNFLCEINTSSITDYFAPTVQTFRFDYPKLLWKNIRQPIGQYINIQIVDLNGKPIKFLPSTEITIHFVIRSSDFDIL